MEDQQQLKPCPFCGGTDISAVEGSTFRWAYLACNTCGGNRGDCRKANSALTADAPENMVELAEDWNRRASPSSPSGDGQVSRLREALEHCEQWLPSDCAAAIEAREVLAASPPQQGTGDAGGVPGVYFTDPEGRVPAIPAPPVAGVRAADGGQQE
jgi:hypothetical protein